MKRLALAAALLGLAACASSMGPGGPRSDWRCDNGAAFSVRFAGNNAEVFAGGQTYSLPVAQSGSGARYSNGAVEYWEHQGEASLNGAAGGPYTHCRQH
ncbi:MAG: MliC family protein [Hyphomonadaceae bacterium]|nr:MliC family protein [Hyphomonadaceae bacterium]